MSNTEADLVRLIGECSGDPLLFVKRAFPWGEKGGELEHYAGPDVWQTEALNRIKEDLAKGLPINLATASGHGVGKSALVSWLILWAMATFEFTRGVVTANTESQLRTKTWPELARWYRLFIAKHWFQMTATSIRSANPAEEQGWRIDAIPWSEKSTEAFAGLHNQGKRILVLFDEACHDDQTEVLTAYGWKFFKDLDGTEPLLTMDLKTRDAEYLRPKALHKSYRAGDMVQYEKRGVSFSVTPNHRMLVTTSKGVTKFTEAGELMKLKNTDVFVPRKFLWTVEDANKITLPALVGRRKYWPERNFDANKMAELLGWYCSEGHITYTHNGYRTVGFTQRDTSRIKKLCDDLGFNAKVYPNCSTPQVRIHDTQFAEWLAQFGIGCKQKGVPSVIRTLSAKQIGIFLDAYRDGDGYVKSKGRDIFYTSSKRLADDLQELISLAGQQSSVTIRALKGKANDFGTHIGISSCDGYVVSRSWNSDNFSLKTKDLKLVPYDGMVYCATLPKHGVLFTRRHGVCMWSGNSAIPDVIWETISGALTDIDTQIIWAAFGNPTRNTGRFRECFGRFKHRWSTLRVDSRTVKITNKDQIRQWVDDYGEDSDFVRVRVKGEFPRAGSMQFIPMDLVDAARKREPEAKLYDPLVMGVDVARFGDDQSVIVLRRGRDAKSVGWITMRGADTMQLAARIVDVANEVRPDAIFVDEGGVGGGVVDRLNMLRQPVIGVQFGGRADRSTQKSEGMVGYSNKRAEMWGNMRDWLKGGMIPDNADLAAELIGVEYGYVIKDGVDVIQLEKKSDMKKRGLSSPDLADALALTFAYPVNPSDHSLAFQNGGKATHRIGYDPLSVDYLRGDIGGAKQQTHQANYDPLNMDYLRRN